MTIAQVRLSETAAAVEARRRGKSYLAYARAKAAGNDDFCRRFDIAVRAAVTPGSREGDDTTAIAPLQPYSAGIIELLRGRSAVASMVGSFRTVPANIRIPRQTSGFTASWIGDSSIAPLTSAAFDSVVLEPRKIKSCCVASRELLKLGLPDVNATFDNDLAGAIGTALDDAFLNPSHAGDNNRPASVTNGATTIAASGSTAAAAASDIRDLIDAAGGQMISPYLVMKPTVATALASFGEPFLQVGARGGQIYGVPVLTTTNVPVDADSPSADIIVYVDAAEILMTLGLIEFGTVEHATIQMSDAPDSPVTGSTATISLWQQGLLGVSALQFASWIRSGSTGVAVLQGAEY